MSYISPIIPVHAFNHPDKEYIYKPCRRGGIEVFVKREGEKPKLFGRIILDDYRKRWQHFRNQQTRALNRLRRRTS